MPNFKKKMFAFCQARIASEFLLHAPPGEFNEVFKKLNELLDENGGTAPVGLYHASYRVFYDVKLAKVLGLEGVNE